MNAVHWVRSRQEESELVYWLSVVAYDPRDRSLNNRLYLIYIVVFFAVWIFAVLTLFAGGGAVILQAVSPADPAGAAAWLLAVLLAAWGLFALRSALRRSPVVFTEEDGLLLGQTPVSRRAVVLRWLWLPWIKNALPFWLAAVTLGFSLIEATVPGEMGLQHLPEYIVHGVRAWLPFVPAHLGLFTLVWVAGVARLHRDQERRWIILPALALAAVLVLPALGLYPGEGILPSALRQLAGVLAYPLRAGFLPVSLGPALAAGWGLALAALALLWQAAEGFSLSRAAQETREGAEITSAMRYGLADYAAERKLQSRLGVVRRPSRLPAVPGPASLVWKDLIQARRSLRAAEVMDWIGLVGAALSFSLLPDPGSRMLALGFWSLQVGKVTSARLRSDLSVWPLTRQLPVTARSLLVLDAAPSLGLALVLSLAALGAGAAAGAPAWAWVLVLPGAAISAAGSAAYDILRRARADLLMNGSAPAVSSTGIIMGAACVLAPAAGLLWMPGPAGLLAAVAGSLALAGLCLRLAERSYGRIGGD